MYEIIDTTNQKRKSLENLSIKDVNHWLIKNKYNLFGWCIFKGISSWSAEYFLRYETNLKI